MPFISPAGNGKGAPKSAHRDRQVTIQMRSTRRGAAVTRDRNKPATSEANRQMKERMQ